MAGGKTLTVNGPLHTIISDLTFNGAGNTIIAGAIDGGGVINIYGGAKPGGLIQAGTGTVTLSGTPNFAGDITVNAGAGPLNLSPGRRRSAAYNGGLLRRRNDQRQLRRHRFAWAAARRTSAAR